MEGNMELITKKSEMLGMSPPPIILNRVDAKRKVVEDIPLYEISALILNQLEKSDLLNELENIYDKENPMVNAKGFLNRTFEFRKHYSRKFDGETVYYSKTLGYPPDNVVSDLFFIFKS